MIVISILYQAWIFLRMLLYRYRTSRKLRPSLGFVIGSLRQCLRGLPIVDGCWKDRMKNVSFRSCQLSSFPELIIRLPFLWEKHSLYGIKRDLDNDFLEDGKEKRFFHRLSVSVEELNSRYSFQIERVIIVASFLINETLSFHFPLNNLCNTLWEFFQTLETDGQNQ